MNKIGERCMWCCYFCGWCLEVTGVINKFETFKQLIKCTQSKGPDLNHHGQVKDAQ